MTVITIIIIFIQLFIRRSCASRGTFVRTSEPAVFSQKTVRSARDPRRGGTVYVPTHIVERISADVKVAIKM